MRAIRLLVLDIDGVITDGSVLLFESGEEARAVDLRDLDAVSRARQLGLQLAILSGENSPSCRRVADRFGISEVLWGAKDKLAGIKELSERLDVVLAETCYVGDADRDVPAIEAAGIGIVPADATAAALSVADHVLEAPGGKRAVAEAIAFLERTCTLPGHRP